ncbi:LON peptidase substrate-binding domain-containing protein [Vibrio aestuarianus]|uniref:LON peptidase substrate-binding domain-containing protein n=1 Tax=Vibrio aestuarianus TaxID=28171 RepID=UPI00237D176F|nr:LON peptidase substrate-binding domain-containing protein [Vibrio aestuarianus]MDE1314813.1 LON peptidase substrate-binding domain-containing protein [Vibrio aestuarianus]
MEELMLFPLASVVLPEGKMKLRIFELRYKRMVTKCCQTDSTFGICLFDNKAKNKSSYLSEFGILVKIVDFEALDDGLLGITVLGIKRFKITNLRTEFDGLRVAQVSSLPNWSVRELQKHEFYLSEQLQKVYKQFPKLAEMYPLCFFDDASWVAQRWLELLPLSNQQFDYLMQQQDASDALDFLLGVIEVSH